MISTKPSFRSLQALFLACLLLSGLPGSSLAKTAPAQARSESQAARIVRLEAELAASRAEQRKLETERDILRQAAKYFAGETNW